MLSNLWSIKKNPGPKDPALVIPGGDFVYLKFNRLWSIGVLEYWGDGVMEEIPDHGLRH